MLVLLCCFIARRVFNNGDKEIFLEAHAQAMTS